MTRTLRVLVTALLAGLLALTGLSPAQARTSAELGTPVPQTHAHNDYEHARPLFDALSHGFVSVEADVWLVDGELLIAHDAEDLDPNRTLEGLYLEPLRQIVKGKGRSVHPGWDGQLQLLIDIKTEGEATYAAIEQALAKYPQVFTRYSHGRVDDGPVTAVISGNRPLQTMQQAPVRRGFYDGRSTDLRSGMSPEFMPLVSENWTKLFTWPGVGEMPAAERAKLVDLRHHRP